MRLFFFCIFLCFSSGIAAEEKPTPCGKELCYTFPERLLRSCYFRSAVSQEDYLLSAINSWCDLFGVHSWSTESFSPIISEVAIKIFKLLGGEEHFIPTRDGKGVIHSLTLRAQDLESKIEMYGGSWQRIRNGKQFAVISPRNPTLRWKAFATSCFTLLGWPRQEIMLPSGESALAYISCNDADLIEDDQRYSSCFLHCHANSHSFIGEGERAGVYLGMKQDICFFDQRGVGLSRGTPSEVGFYLDIEAVYDKLMQAYAYPIENLWVGGFCAGCPTAAYLKAKFHTQRINFFAEQGFSDLARDFIETRTPIVRWIGRRSYGGLKSYDIPIDFPERPEEYQFSIERMWETLPFVTEGKVIILHTQNDQFLPDFVREHFVEAAQKISQNTFPIFYTSDRGDPHSDVFFLYPEVKRRFIEVVFKE